MRARVVVFWIVVGVLGLAALSITAARLAESDLRIGVTLTAFTPLALGLYAAVLLLALIRSVWTRRWRAAALPVALLALAGLVLHGWWFSPQLVGANPPPAAGATPMVVMTANLMLGEADGIELVRTVSEEGVDLLVLEEVTPAVLADMDRAGLADLLPHRVGEAGSMASGTMAFARTPLTDAAQLPDRARQLELRDG